MRVSFSERVDVELASRGPMAAADKITVATSALYDAMRILRGTDEENVNQIIEVARHMLDEAKTELHYASGRS